MVTQDVIVENETFEGTSTISYDDALHSALRAHTISSGPDCTINVVIFGSSYNEDDETYRISIQIIVTRPALKPEDKNIHDEPLPEPKPRSDIDLIMDIPDNLAEIMHATTSNILLQFNHEGIHDVLKTRLEHTWEINPQSQLALDLKQTVEEHLPVPLFSNDTPKKSEKPQITESLQYKNMRFFTEEMDNLSILLPPEWRLGFALFEHLYEKSVEKKLKKELAEKYEQVPHKKTEFKKFLKELMLYWH